MKKSKIKQVMVALMVSFLVACEDYLEIESPQDRIVSKTVFNDDETALSAMMGIYNQLASVSFSSGGPDSVTVLAGLSADNLSPIRTTNRPYLEFEQHEILPDNFRNLNLWSSAYNIIYMTNSLLEGLENSQKISKSVHDQLEGQARFVRAFTYFYLINLYGDIPLILTTNYRENALTGLESEELVYQQVLSDLQIAMDQLEDIIYKGRRIQINRYAAIALMARVQLYLENWYEAEKYASQVIDQSGYYEIHTDLDQVFLANSREAIWQLSPKGRGSILTNTNEGATFIIHPFLSFLAQLKLTDGFEDSFEKEDKRLQEWIRFHPGTKSYYSFKYKIDNSTEEDISEYSMVLRLAEQFLIRAEARAKQENLTGAIGDLDKIRERAGLDLIANTNPSIDGNALLNLIMEERQRELFTEWGHRWLDLKRTGKTGEVLGAANSLWEESDVLYPIPESERMKNPNLALNHEY